MKIALIGYGKMGKTIEEIAIDRGHEVIIRVNSSNPIEAVDLSEADVAIEFTKPGMAVKHIEFCAESQVPVVVGTTAWSEHLEYVVNHIKRHDATLLHASNFSIGVNIFFDINRRLAKLMNDYPEYGIHIDETHHIHKLDAPSGTAVTLANEIMLENNNVSSWIHEENEVPESTKDQITVTSFREKDVPGTHAITYKSDIDEIKIEHRAFNRQGFGLGAVIAAEWLVDKKGVYTMQDIIHL